MLVPYPYAADDHQTFNAKVFEDAGAAILRQESDMDAGSLVADITRLCGDDSAWKGMKDAADGLAVKNASAQICDVITG